MSHFSLAPHNQTWTLCSSSLVNYEDDGSEPVDWRADDGGRGPVDRGTSDREGRRGRSVVAKVPACVRALLCFELCMAAAASICLLPVLNAPARVHVGSIEALARSPST